MPEILKDYKDKEFIKIAGGLELARIQALLLVDLLEEKNKSKKKK